MSWVTIWMAFAFGIQTAISPCPLAANIAAMSYVGRRVDRPPLVLFGGALFAFGQVLAYVGLAALLAWPVTRSDSAAVFLERYLTQALGPLLIVTGVFLLELVSLNFGSGISQRLRKRAESLGLVGSLILGAILALAFCPTTAALYFLQLIPLALRHDPPMLLPLVFALGAAVPVLGMALVLALAANRVGAAYKAIGTVEKWARRVTGVAFIGCGIYLTLVHVYGVFA